MPLAQGVEGWKCPSRVLCLLIHKKPRNITGFFLSKSCIIISMELHLDPSLSTVSEVLTPLPDPPGFILQT